MKELIEKIKLKAHSIPTNTKENRKVKGAYVDCLMMINETEQQERMYSEEDLKEAYKSCYTPLSFGKIGDLDEDFKEWFEQFKKEDKQ